MRTLHIIIAVDKALDKVTLLKELLYPTDNFFRLTSIWKWNLQHGPQWCGLELSEGCA